MPRRFPRQNCKVCGGHRDVVGDMTARGNCIACAVRLQKEACRQMSVHHGPYFEHWRRRCVAAFGGVLVDDLTQER